MWRGDREGQLGLEKDLLKRRAKLSYECYQDSKIHGVEFNSVRKITQHRSALHEKFTLAWLLASDSDEPRSIPYLSAGLASSA